MTADSWKQDLTCAIENAYYKSRNGRFSNFSIWYIQMIGCIVSQVTFAEGFRAYKKRKRLWSSLVNPFCWWLPQRLDFRKRILEILIKMPLDSPTPEATKTWGLSTMWSFWSGVLGCQDAEKPLEWMAITYCYWLIDVSSYSKQTIWDFIQVLFCSQTLRTQ